MNGGELTSCLVALQPLDQFCVNVVRVLLGCPVIGKPRDARLGREPVSGAILIEIGRPVREPPERIAKGGNRLARLGTPQADAAVVDAGVVRPENSPERGG